MTIPPASERADRRCRSCVFSWEDDYLDQNCPITYNVNRDHETPLKPCKYHFTVDEMTDIMDDINSQQEQQP